MSDGQQPPEMESLHTTLASGGESQDTFWSGYKKQAEEYDQELVERYETDLEIVVFFAGLFSAVVAAFLGALQPALSPNPSDTTNALLTILIYTIDNSTFTGQPSTVPQVGGPPSTVVYSQALGYVSLSLSLFCALGAVVGKQWVGRFSRLGTGTDEVRGRRRQRKLEALHAWKFHTIMELLPALLQVALALFATALCINLWGINRAVAVAFISVTALSGLVYLAFTAASLLFPSCPYQTPLSTVIRWMIITALDISWELGAWRRENLRSKLSIRPLARLLPLLLLPVFGWGTIVLVFQVTIAWAAITWLSAALPYQASINLLVDIMIDLVSPGRYQQSSLPPYYLDFSPEIWTLEVSSCPAVMTRAMARVSDAATALSSSLRIGFLRAYNVQKVQRHKMHLYPLFINSVYETRWELSGGQRERAALLGKALVCILRFSQIVERPDDTPRSSIIDETSRSSIAGLLQDDTLDSDIAYLLHLALISLPVANNAKSEIFPEEPSWQKADRIPLQTILWSLSLFRQGRQQQEHWNLRLMGFFSTLHPALACVCFSDGREWSTTEQLSYLQACQAYLQILRQMSTLKSKSVHDMYPPEYTIQNLIYQILRNLHDMDESLRVGEDGCLPELFSELLLLLKHFPSWPDDIRTLAHELQEQCCNGEVALKPTG